MIAIPNMEKPNYCWQCPINNCDYREENMLSDDCPLIEIDLVRCGECKQLDHTKWCDLFLHYMNEDDFCSYGERRSDEL